eukprot:24331_1
MDKYFKKMRFKSEQDCQLFLRELLRIKNLKTGTDGELNRKRMIIQNLGNTYVPLFNFEYIDNNENEKALKLYDILINDININISNDKEDICHLLAINACINLEDYEKG